jgi:hypothetical protein
MGPHRLTPDQLGLGLRDQIGYFLMTHSWAGFLAFLVVFILAAGIAALVIWAILGICSSVRRPRYVPPPRPRRTPPSLGDPPPSQAPTPASGPPPVDSGGMTVQEEKEYYAAQAKRARRDDRISADERIRQQVRDEARRYRPSSYQYRSSPRPSHRSRNRTHWYWEK